MADSLATLGLIVDATGAQREIKLTTEQLKTLANGGKEASAVLKTLAPPAVVQQMQATTNALRQSNAAVTANIQAHTRATAAGAGFGEMVERVAEHAEKGHLSLGRVNLALEALAFESVGANSRLGSIATKFAEFGVGGIATAAILAGLAAVGAAWEHVTAETRKAKEEHDKYKQALGEDANNADFAKVSQAGRTLLYGKPFDEKGNLIENSKLVAGAFKGSLADMEASYAAMIAQLPKGVEYAKGQLARDINDLTPKLNDAREKFKDFQAAMANLAAQPAGTPGQIVGVTTSADSDGKIAKDQEQAIAEQLDRLNEAKNQQRRIYQEEEDFAISILTDQIRQEDELRQSAIDDQLAALNDAMHEQRRLYKENEDETIRIVEEQARKEEEIAKRKHDYIRGQLQGLAEFGLSNFGGQYGGLAAGVGNAAMSGFEAGGPWAAALGGAVALTTGLFGMSKAAKEAAERLKQAQSSFQDSFALYQQGIFGTVTDEDRAKAAAKQQHDDYAKQIEDIYAGKKFEQERNRLLKDNNDAYTQNLANIAKQTDALNGLSQAMLNVVYGYSLQSTIFKAATPRGGPLAPTLPHPYTSPGGQPLGDLRVAVVLDSQTVGSAVIRNFRTRSQAQTGDASNWTELRP